MTETVGFSILVIMETLADRIAFLRKGLGLTQEEFAGAVSDLLIEEGQPGITRGAVGGWELGKGIAMSRLKAVSQLTSASLDWIANNAGVPPDAEALRRIGAQLLGVPPPPATVLVFGQAAGATLDEGATILDHVEPIGELPMMPGLVGIDDIYGLEATGTSMIPMFRHGDPIYLSKSLAAHTDDAVVIIEHRSRNGGPVAFLKIFVRETRDTVFARQLNPPLDIAYTKKNGLTVHRVFTARELLGYAGFNPDNQLPSRQTPRRGPKR